MGKRLYAKDWVRKYVYFSGTKARIQIPMAISITVHLVLFILTFVLKPQYVNTVLEVKIMSTADIMSVQKETKFSQAREKIKTSSAEQKNKNRGADRESIFEGSENRRNSQDKATSSEGFITEYESTLFNQKGSFEHTVNPRETVNPGDLEWDEKKYDFDNRKKEKIVEKLKVPGGHGESRSYVWKEGYSRKLVFQPEIEYPFFFRKQGIQASVHIQIEVNSSGNVISAEILHSSGYSKLDILARNGILKARFAPRENTKNMYDTGEVEVQFRLNK